MSQYVIIFRQEPNQLSDVDLQNRARETGAWAQRENAAGHKLDPHILVESSHWAGPPVAGGTPVTALLFLEARDFADAMAVARAHPGIRYGASVDVRPWARPPTFAPAAEVG